MAGNTTPKKRAARPASERAQEELDVATRAVETLDDRIAKAEKVVADLKAQKVDAEKRRDYAALNPALPAQSDPEPEALDGGTP